MIANNRWLDTPAKVEAYCNQVGMDLANYALGIREDPQTFPDVKKQARGAKPAVNVKLAQAALAWCQRRNI